MTSAKHSIALALTLLLASGFAQARACATVAEPRSVDYPWMSIERWRGMHEGQLQVAAKGNFDLMFIGDSITEGWPASVWQKSFGQYRAANFGIGGDHTGNLLWRLQDPRMAQLKPKVIVLLIGVNNLGLCSETAQQVFPGLKAVVSALRKQYPSATILLNAVLPADEKADGERRKQIVALNALVAGLHDGRRVVYRDYGKTFLQPDGSIAKETMPDFLHLSEPAYQKWADAMLPDVRQLMK